LRYKDTSSHRNGRMPKDTKRVKKERLGGSKVLGYPAGNEGSYPAS